MLRFFLTAFFAFLILLRPKPGETEGRAAGRWFVQALVVAGTVSVLLGIVFNVHQIEWIGLLLILYACLLWALPGRYSRDLALSLLLLYWAHPLPGQLFGPAQVAMQRMSVGGAEWLLHAMNVSVWADGLVLRTAADAYEVPAWCSGMRTAATVFLLALGLGVLKRLRWYECVFLVTVAVAQALMLNIVRISTMVVLTPKLALKTGTAFLHNSAAVIVLGASAMVYFEVLLLRRLKRRGRVRETELSAEQIRLLADYPASWHEVMRYKWVLVGFLATLVLGVVLASRTRPFHRTRMLKGVVAGLRAAGKLEDAQRAAEVVRRRIPYEADWQFVILSLLLLRGKYDEVLAGLPQVPDFTKDQTLRKKILKAYCFMSLNRLEDAAAIVEELPNELRSRDPRVAMILASLAFRTDDPDEVAEKIVIASQWKPNAERIRLLYPYLRRYRKWDAITRSDLKVPYRDPAQALSAAEANMNLNRSVVVADIALHAIAAWPDDFRVLEPVFFMAIKRGRGEWEERFGKHLVRSAKVMRNPEDLYRLFDKCFQLARPDFAWFVYGRIREIDPSHPALFMSAANHGHEWFTFRRRSLGMSALLAGDRVDMKSFYHLGLSFPSWRRLCRRIPLGKTLAVSDTVAVRKQFLDRAIDEFQERDSRGQLSLAMQYEHARALEMAGDIDAAVSRLREIAVDNPEQRSRVRVAFSEIYERAGDWQNVYETLRTYPSEQENPALNPLLRLVRAQMKLHLGLAALQTSRQIFRLFASSTQALDILVTILGNYDSHEEALFLLSRPRIRHQRSLDLLEVESLFQTERFVEMTEFCRTVWLPTRRAGAMTKQALFLPPAELSLLWHRIRIPSEREFSKNAKMLTENLKTVTSPYLSALMNLWLACYRSHCEGEGAETEKWLACGRDDVEKGIALSQLTLLLCREERFIDARNVAGRAVKLLPQDAILWRILISLSGCDQDVITAARRSCPADSEIWLAELVARTAASDRLREKEVSRWVEAEIRRAAKQKTYSPAAMTRAGDYLFNRGFKNIAAVAARDATGRARGLLPAYVLGVKCALTQRDRGWALLCTRKAIEASLRPPPLFYRKVVELKMENGVPTIDADMVEALSQLHRGDPGNLLWAQMLGYVRFKRGGWEILEAVNLLTGALARGATSRLAYGVAAEASRLLGNYDRAEDLLRKGLERYPDDPAMLNNLVFTLSLQPDKAAETLRLLPRLLARGGDDPQVMDTVTVAYLNCGNISKAEKHLAWLLERVEDGSPMWFRAKTHEARVAFRRHRPYQSEAILTEILKSAKRASDEDLLAANALLAEVRQIISGKTTGNQARVDSEPASRREDY